MKIWTSEHVFNHPWETVVLASWRKYPNPINSSVTGFDTVDRTVDTTGQMKTHRVLSTEWGCPEWITRLIGMNRACYVSEHSEISPKDRVMTLRSRNLTFCNFVTIDEQLKYTPHPTDPSSTILRSESTICVYGLPMTNYMENCIKGTMTSKASQGRQAMEWVISRLKEETQEIGRAAREEFGGLKNLTNNFTTSSL